MATVTGKINRVEYEAYAARFARALEYAGLTPGQFARVLAENPLNVTDRAFIGKCLAAEAMPYDYQRVDFAAVLDVDPRWLATGAVSEVAKAAMRIPPLYPNLGSPAMIEKVRENLAMMTQPAGVEDVCRYCGVTRYSDSFAHRHWVDDLHTICDACLEVPREE